MRELHLDLDDRSYPIYIGEGLLHEPDLLRRHIAGSEVMVVSNETVGPLYLQVVLDSLSDLNVTSLQLPDGEAFKTLDTLNLIFDALLSSKHSRKTTLLALGGGVVGDMTGFAAACYQRGVEFVQIPTTLLSQVDSSVGGKTAVNHPHGKNMIGAFYQPRAVIIDTRLLATLPEREFAAGMAEVIKYGLIADKEFHAWLMDNAAALRAQDPQALAHAIEKSCAIKADVVAQDETEQGVRAILNFGHTFGHAIETCMGYKGILHGEAVAIGMLLAARMSHLEGSLSEEEVSSVAELLQSFALPLQPPQGLSKDAIAAAMQVDKKVVEGSLRLVLLNAIGSARVTSDFTPDLLDATLDSAFH